MKKLILLITAMAMCLGLMAQTPIKAKDMQKRLFDMKVAEMALKLEMTDEQKTKFVPVYTRYNDEMRELWHGKRLKEAKDENEKTRLKMERQHEAQAVRLKYFDEFGKVLSAKQMKKLYDTEDEIQKQLKQRHRHAMQNVEMKKGRDMKLQKKTGNCPKANKE